MAAREITNWIARRRGGSMKKLRRSLGWLAVGIGAAEVLIPALTSKSGSNGRSPRDAALRGARKLASGVGLIAGPGHPLGMLSFASRRVLERQAGSGRTQSRVPARANERPAPSNGRISPKTAAVVAGLTVAGAIAAKKLGVFGRGERTILHSDSVAVNRPPEECYRYWHNPHNLPKFFKHLKGVHAADGRLEWLASGPLGKEVSCAVELTEDTGETIAWRSLGHRRISQSGWVRFEAMPGCKGTVVRLHVQYELPAASGVVRRLLGRDPALRIRKILLRFKQLLETGEIATTEGQPSGRPTSTTWLDRMASV